jgi:type III secretion system FlhB-like substrate exporter
LAKEAGVPVTESAELARALMHVELDREIPAELYAAVAEILAWIWRLQTKKAGS